MDSSQKRESKLVTDAGINRFGINLLQLGPIALPERKSDLAEWSFFFDLDGTLLDLALTPDAVRVEDGLRDALEILADNAAGAMAIITGRSIDFVDELFPNHSFTVAGLHGGFIRLSPSLASNHSVTDIALTLPDAFIAAREFARISAEKHPEILFEDKGRAFSLHYRLAPEREAVVRHIMSAAAELAGEDFVLQDGKFVVELKPNGGDKGTAIEALMRLPPFQNRKPLAAGDDVTDEAMFRVVNDLGGVSMRVGAVPAGMNTAAALQISSPVDFRLWIRSLIE